VRRAGARDVGPEPYASDADLKEDSTTRTRELQVSAIKHSAGADCCDLRWATEGLNFSEERFGGAASRGGPGVNLD